jgi:branched-chain amino acid transport system substrate-binding protein
LPINEHELHFKDVFSSDLIMCRHLILLITFLVSACSDPKPIDLVFFGSITGPTADLGLTGRDGVVLAVEHQNAKGGINGRPIELRFYDAEGSVETGQQLMRDIVESKPTAIIGPMTSGMAKATHHIADEAEIVMMGITVSTNDLTSLDDYFFRPIADSKGHATAQGRYITGELKLSRVCFIRDLGNEAFTTSWSQDFQSGFQGDASRVCDIAYTSSPDMSVQSIVDQVLEQESDVVAIAANASDTAKFIKSLKQSGSESEITASGWAGTARLIEFAGKYVEGSYITQAVDRYSQLPRYLAFVDEFETRFGGIDPGFPGMQGYNAATALFRGLEKATSKMPLKEALLSLDEMTFLQETTQFNQFGDVDSTQYLSRVEDGKFITIAPLR